MDQLPLEIASSVLKYFNFNELINISSTKLPENFHQAIREKRVWKAKCLKIKNFSDLKSCLNNIYNVKNCTRISFNSSSINDKSMLLLLDSIDIITQLSLDNFISLEDETLQKILKKHGAFLKHLSLKGCQHLTNFTLAQISKYCRSLVTLNISECSFSSSGLEYLSDNENFANSLRNLDVSRCYLLDQGAILPLSKLNKLSSLSLRNMEWLNSNNLAFIIENNFNIHTIDVRNCDDFTKQSVEQVKTALNRPIEILENCKLVDDSSESIRGYLMAMINGQIH